MPRPMSPKAHRHAPPPILTLILAAILPGPAIAAEPALPPADPRAAIGLVVENDAFVSNRDRWYTDGVRLSFTSAEDALPAPMAWLDARLAALFGPARSRWGLAIGQSIFTPVDLDRRNPDPRDRPYAGYLYAQIGLERRTADRLDRVALQLGVVGPSALAEQAQTFAHSILDQRPSLGWAFQLRDEPVFNLHAERIWRLALAAPAEGLEMDALPALSLAAGTVQVHAGLGVRLRLGQGLARDFGPPRIRPAIADGAPPVGEGFGWYLFAGAGGRAVARDIFLDGNTFRDSRSVDREPVVGEFEIGAALLWNGLRLSATHVWRTPEFEGRGDYHRFGVLSLTLAF